MNTRGVWALVRSSWITQMQSRSFYWIIALGWMMPVLIYLLVWRAAGDLTAHGLPGAPFSQRGTWRGRCVSSGAIGGPAWPFGPPAPMRSWRCKMRWCSS